MELEHDIQFCTHTHERGELVINRNTYDPTRTTSLRNAFAADMKRRFASLVRDIKFAVVTQDVFGLKPLSTFATGPGARSFAFLTTTEKTQAFMQWVQGRVDAGILQVGTGSQLGTAINPAWTDLYITDSYKRGVARARYEMGNVGMAVPSLTETGGIAASMSTPFHMDRVGMMHNRTFQELKGITASMDTQISQILAQGLVDGDGPEFLARKLTRTITGPDGDLGLTDTLGRRMPPQRRAMILARTEIIRAHHVANIQEMRNWGVAGVSVQAEWTTAGDSRVCQLCVPLEGNIFTLDEIEGRIPLHPGCRCMALPTLPEDVVELLGGDTKNLFPDAQGFASCVTPGTIGVYKPSSCTDYYRQGAFWYRAGKKIVGKDLDRINTLKVPPAWKEAVVAVNPNQKIQAIGLDAAGRWQYRYSAQHIAEAAQKKFNRIKLFTRDIPGIRRSITAGVNEGRLEAYLLRLEDLTGIRAGSLADRRAKVKAYGLTTLQHEHIVIKGNRVFLEFVAKEGISASYEITDPVLIQWLKGLKANTQVGERLFTGTNASKLNSYLKELAGKDYSLKDFRTLIASQAARELLRPYVGGAMLNTVQKKAIIKNIAEEISELLHNTPSMALKSYIDPMVWEIIGGL